MSIWGSILIAVAAAVTTIGLNELVRILRDRAAARRLAADWDIELAPHDTVLGVRVAIIENVGAAVAFNVDVTITGNSKFEFHPDAPLDKARPRDAILVMVENPGTGVYKIDWTDAKGIAQGPVFRFPPPF